MCERMHSCTHTHTHTHTVSILICLCCSCFENVINRNQCVLVGRDNVAAASLCLVPLSSLFDLSPLLLSLSLLPLPSSRSVLFAKRKIPQLNPAIFCSLLMCVSVCVCICVCVSVCVCMCVCVRRAAAPSIHHPAVSNVSLLLEVLSTLALIVTAAQTRHTPSPSYLHTHTHTHTFAHKQLA